MAFGAATWVGVSGTWLWIGGVGIVGTVSLALIPAYILTIGTGITGGTMRATERPNQGTWRSLLAMGLISLAAMIPLLFVGITAGFAGREGLVIGAAMALLGVGIGLGVGMTKGGLSVLKHLVIRLLLAAAGALPWDLRRLLDAGANRLILRRVGGGYEFIHRLLAEHLARLGDAELERVAAERMQGQ